jgi:hypothetical protein
MVSKDRLHCGEDNGRGRCESVEEMASRGEISVGRSELPKQIANPYACRENVTSSVAVLPIVSVALPFQCIRFRCLTAS